MSFTTTPMVGNRVLVRGSDAFGHDGETVVDSTQWEEIKQHRQVHVAQEEYDAAVEEFFAPLLAAAEAMGQAIEKPERDSINYVTLHEGVEPVKGEAPHIVKLGKDAVILRLIEQGDHARLVWVNGDLEVLEVAVNVASSATNAGALPADADPS